MDRYNNFMITGKCNSTSTPIPGEYASNGYRRGTNLTDVYGIEISFDQFANCINNRKYMNLPFNFHFKIYDEDIIRTREDCMLRLQFLKYLNTFRNARFDFYLSDSTLPLYIDFMNKTYWSHDYASNIKMRIDRNPTESKEHIPLEEARSKIDINEEKLLWFSDKSIRLAAPKLEHRTTSEDTMKLKQFIDRYMDLIDRNYKTSSMTERDKVYLAYHYLFDNNRSRNIDITPLNIVYADERTYRDMFGVQRLNPSRTRWESRPAGTLEHRRGVCSGQARLFNSLICNPENKIAADATCGVIPSGELHCWSSFVIDDHLYQCCTTMKGLFTDLDYAGYIPDSDQLFQKAYPHFHLDEAGKNKIKRHLHSIRR